MNTHGGIISQTDLDNIIEKIKKDVAYQKQFIQDQDPIKNIPLDPIVFRKTSSERKCESCTFREVCKKLV
jgi:CRISPR/Cas system-associated exonuclease Cas4 (RecB family)